MPYNCLWAEYVGGYKQLGLDQRQHFIVDEGQQSLKGSELGRLAVYIHKQVAEH